jgi:DNA-binding MarR family transcriptional regulator
VRLLQEGCPPDDRTTIYLDESRVSHQWYNAIADLILQEVTTDRHVDIPAEVRDVHRGRTQHQAGRAAGTERADGYADQVGRSLLDSPSYRLIRAFGRYKALVGGELERHGLHLGQEFYLAQLWHEDGITSADLAARTGVSAPAVTKVVGGLERSGLVRRERDPADARLVRVWLTDAGRALREPVTAIWYGAERTFWSGLSDEERSQVREAVDTLLA